MLHISTTDYVFVAFFRQPSVTHVLVYRKDGYRESVRFNVWIALSLKRPSSIYNLIRRTRIFNFRRESSHERFLHCRWFSEKCCRVALICTKLASTDLQLSSDAVKPGRDELCRANLTIHTEVDLTVLILALGMLLNGSISSHLA